MLLYCCIVCLRILCNLNCIYTTFQPESLPQVYRARLVGHNGILAPLQFHIVWHSLFPYLSTVLAYALTLLVPAHPKPPHSELTLSLILPESPGTSVVVNFPEVECPGGLSGQVDTPYTSLPVKIFQLTLHQQANAKGNKGPALQYLVDVSMQPTHLAIAYIVTRVLSGNIYNAHCIDITRVAD